MAQGTATVKSVLSGDTVILIGKATNGPPPELMLTLASLQAPRLTRNPEQNNEPFAWASREFLRKLVVGKQVLFKVEYSVSAIKRDFGSIWLDGINICVTVAAAGWARVKEGREGEQSPDVDEMLRVAAEATSNQLGLHQSNAELAATSIQYEGANPEALLGQHQGMAIDAIIESFRDGASMRILLLDSMFVLNFGLAGIACPRMNTPSKSTDSSSVPAAPEAFARQAKYFSETRLLQRDVKVLLQGVDNYGNLYGTIVHKAGNISIELIKHGLAKMVDWTSVYLPLHTRSALRNMERDAKQKRLGVWKNYVAPVLSSSRQCCGTIIEVCSGDTIVLWVDGKEQRLSLSSIRAPRLGNARRAEPHAPFALEAKEFLRSKCIGKVVTVSMEYEREAAADAIGVAAQPRRFASLKTSGKKEVNLALLVVSEGLAQVIRHRAEEERSAHYDDLLEAEEQALKGKKKIHSNKVPAAVRYTDLSTDPTKAKQYLPFLKREKRVKGIVEFVASGSRLKIFVPKENCLINFVVSGLRCPSAARKATASSAGKSLPARPAEAFGEEAKSFARTVLMQRDVEIGIEDMDRGGNIFGPLYMGGKKTNYGAALLQAGLARVDEYSVDRTQVADALWAAQQEAKSASKGLWLNAAKEEVLASPVVVESSGPIAVQVSEIIGGGHLYVHKKTSNAALADIEEKLKAFTALHGTVGAPVTVKKGSVVAALFADPSGPSWFRAKIESVSGNDVVVRYMDYGNSASLSIQKLRPLDSILASVPAQATECALAFLKVPTVNEDFGQEAGEKLADMTWGKSLMASVHGKDENGRLLIVLYDATMNCNENLLEAGLARVNRKSKDASREIFAAFMVVQQKAMKNHICMWRYGDVQSDDEEPVAWARRR